MVEPTKMKLSLTNLDIIIIITVIIIIIIIIITVIIVIIIRVICVSRQFCNTRLFSTSSFCMLCPKNFEVMKLAATW